MANAYKSQVAKSSLPRIYELFKNLDLDGSGEISVHELHDAPPQALEEFSQFVNLEDLDELLSRGFQQKASWAAPVLNCAASSCATAGYGASSGMRFRFSLRGQLSWNPEAALDPDAERRAELDDHEA